MVHAFSNLGQNMLHLPLLIDFKTSLRYIYFTFTLLQILKLRVLLYILEVRKLNSLYEALTMTT